MKKEDLEDLLARTVALLMVPILQVLIENQTEGIEIGSDEAAEKLTKRMKGIVLKSFLDWENVRPGGIGPEAVRDDLRKLEGEIFNE